ncbi:hypothetical protein FKM82_011503 [Ascaphus truei]
MQSPEESGACAETEVTDYQVTNSRANSGTTYHRQAVTSRKMKDRGISGSEADQLVSRMDAAVTTRTPERGRPCSCSWCNAEEENRRTRAQITDVTNVIVTGGELQRDTRRTRGRASARRGRGYLIISHARHGHQ